MVVKVTCSHCFATLKLADASKLGRKLKCPKCAEVFVAEADEEEVVDDEEAEEVTPVRSKRGGSASAGRGGKTQGGKKGKQKTGVPVAVWAGGGVAALAALVLVGLWLGGFFGKSDATPMAAAPPRPKYAIDLSWIPADAEIIMHARVADLWQSAVVKDWVGMVAAFGSGDPEEQLKQMTGLGLDDIESITVGVPGFTDQLLASRSVGMAPPTTNDRAVAVVHVKKPVTEEMLTQGKENVSKSSVKDKPVFTFPSANSGPAPGAVKPPDFAVCLMSSQLLLLGNKPGVEGALNAGETGPTRPEWTAISPGWHVVIAAAPMDPAKIKASYDQPGEKPMFLTTFVPRDRASMRYMGLGLKFGGGIDAQAVIDSTADEISKMKTETETQLSELRANFNDAKARLPPLVVEVGQLLLDSVKLDAKDTRFTVAAGVPDSAQDKLKQLPGIAMGYIMMQGMNPGGGRGPVAPPNNPLPPQSPGNGAP